MRNKLIFFTLFALLSLGYASTMQKYQKISQQAYTIPLNPKMANTQILLRNQKQGTTTGNVRISNSSSFTSSSRQGRVAQGRTGQASVKQIDKKQISSQSMGSTNSIPLKTIKKITETINNLGQINQQYSFLPVPGSYFPIDDLSQNQQAQAAFNFVRQTFPLLKGAKLFKSSYQVVAGFNYEFIFQIEYAPNIKLFYRVVVYYNLEGKFSISANQYYGLTAAENLLHFNNKSQVPYVDKINEKILSKLKDSIPASAELVDFDINPPYYIFQYKVGHNNFAKIQLVYDVIADDLNIISTSRQTIQTTGSIENTNQNQGNAVRTKSNDLKKLTSSQSSFGQSKYTDSALNSGLSGSQSQLRTISSSSSSSFSSSSSGKLIPSVSTTTVASTQKVNVPIYIRKQIFQKYGILESGISFSNIVEYKSKSDDSFIDVDNAPQQIKDLVQAILQSILPQIEKIDDKYNILAIKFKLQEGRLFIFLMTTIRGQKSMQTITIKVPKKSVYDQFYNQITSLATNSGVNAQPSIISKTSTSSSIESQSKLKPITQSGSLRIDTSISKQTTSSDVNTKQIVSSSIETSSPTSSSSPLKKNYVQSSIPIIPFNSSSITVTTKKSKPAVSTQTITSSSSSSSLSSSSSSSSSSSTSSSYDSSSNLVMQHKETKPSVPKYTISQNPPTLLSSLSGISDPALVPFLTSSSLTSATNQIDSVLNFIINKVKINGDFTVLLINQIKYGIRVVLQINQDHKLFEAVITQDQGNPQLVSWRRISTIMDINPDIFSNYYRVQPDEDLKMLIRQVFKNEEIISKFKQVISSQKKISFDGIYYRLIVQSISNNQFLLVFYYIPEKSFTQVLQYELLNNGYVSSQESRLQSLPDENDKWFILVRELLMKNYALILKDTVITYIASYQTAIFRYYRIVFEGLSGRYEAIIAVGLSNSLVTIFRWQKLEDGYVGVDINKLNNNQEFRSIRSSVKDYVKQKFSIQAVPSYLQVKNIPGYNSYYKFLFDRPFPFILYLQERDSDHSLYIRGMERVQIAPASQYYNDRLFAGYSLSNIAELKYDEVYGTFYTILTSKTSVTDSNHEVLAAFRLMTPAGLFYKVIYRVSGVLYLASFSFNFATKQYKLISFDAYQNKIQQGDYRWKCQLFNKSLKICEKCQASAILTSGRCYRRSKSCNLQLASICYICESGNIRTNGQCQTSPEKAVPKPKPEASSEQTIVTATGCKNVVYTYENDNCLAYKDSLCTKCSYRYFLVNGICKKAQDQCDTYDSNSGICYKCYENYYLSNGYCIALDPLCAEANSDGYCTKCYKNYINIEGKCYIKSNIQISQSSFKTPADQLCIEWSGSKCLKCEFGCFMSSKTGKCTIKDPYCQEWSDLMQECDICQRGYAKNAGRKCERVY